MLDWYHSDIHIHTTTKLHHAGDRTTHASAHAIITTTCSHPISIQYMHCDHRDNTSGTKTVTMPRRNNVVAPFDRSMNTTFKARHPLLMSR